MKKYLNVLKKCPLFYGIKEDKLLIMLDCLGAAVQKFDKKYTVFAEGAPAKYIGIVLSGSVQLQRNDYYGNRTIISNISQGGIFGEAFACAEIDFLPVSVIANEESEIMLIDCCHILHTCSNNCGFHQQLIFNLMKELAQKTILFHQKIEITSKRTTREKLMEFLMQEAKKNGSESFYISFNRQELADFLEVDRSGLSAQISKLRQEGILESKKNYFRLI